MALITYANKVALNPNPTVPDINKVNASDMNMLKSVVNTNAGILTYSASSGIDTGKIWIDGKKIYRYTMETTVPSTQNAWVDIGDDLSIESIKKVVDLYGILVVDSSGRQLKVPFYLTDSNYCNLAFSSGHDSVQYYGNGSFSGLTMYIVIEYTNN